MRVAVQASVRHETSLLSRNATKQRWPHIIRKREASREGASSRFLISPFQSPFNGGKIYRDYGRARLICSAEKSAVRRIFNPKLIPRPRERETRKLYRDMYYAERRLTL